MIAFGKTVVKEIRPGSSALRIQVLVFVQREKLYKHQLPSCLNLLCTTKWVRESQERIPPPFRRTRHRLAVPQTKGGRRTKNARHRKEVAWISVQTYASIKPSAAEVQKRDENVRRPLQLVSSLPWPNSFSRAGM